MLTGRSVLVHILKYLDLLQKYSISLNFLETFIFWIDDLKETGPLPFFSARNFERKKKCMILKIFIDSFYKRRKKQ